MIMQYILLLVLLLASPGCNRIQTKIENAESIAYTNNFVKKLIKTTDFNIVSFQKIKTHSDDAVFYIEGDGQAWLNKRRVSPNPTPKDPVALKLASIDDSSTVIYLARPCQYLNLEKEPRCQPDYWTNKRASKEVIESMNSAISEIKKQLEIKKIRLVGYSGGATIAAILASTRNDIIDLRTLAGNLDIDVFTRIHEVSPLSGSLNPIDYAEQLSKIPQIHFISTNDSIITYQIIESYINELNKFDNGFNCFKVLGFKQATHTKGWLEIWKDNIGQTQNCSASVIH